MTPIKLGNQQILQVKNKFLSIYIDDELEWGDLRGSTGQCFGSTPFHHLH